MRVSRRIKFTLAAVLASAAVVSCWPRGSSAERLLGVPVPPSARVIDVVDRAGSFGGDSYVVLEMPEADFRVLVRRIGLFHRPDLLEYWPGALDAHGVVSWHASAINDDGTFFGDQRPSTYLVARYEGGRMYYKVHVY